MDSTTEPHNWVEVTVVGRIYKITPCPDHQRYVTAGFMVPGCRKCKVERR